MGADEEVGAVGVLPAGYAHAAAALAVLYGVPVLGFALLWLAIGLALVLRAARAGLPFTMTWWGFTFPLGTCVTGASSLAGHSGLDALRWLSFALFALLATASATAWTGTARSLVVARGSAPARA
jgi:tellurite resistance protein TehA-like permease